MEVIKSATGGKGAICIDAVGFEAIGHHNHARVENPSLDPQNPVQVLTWISEAARKFSTVGIPGVYGRAYDQFPIGTIFRRELQLRMGQCPVKDYNEQLLYLIEVGRVDFTPLISHRMKLEQAPEDYKIFNERGEATKMIFTP